MKKIKKDYTAKQVTDEFIEWRYNIDPNSREGKALALALDLSYDSGRKMYYFLGKSFLYFFD